VQGVAFFFKQWGGVRKARTGRELMAELTTSIPILFECRAIMLKSRQLAGKTGSLFSAQKGRHLK
jgi:hypothetical protein